MSTGDVRRMRGFTFPEVAVVIALTTFLALVIERTITSTHANGRFLEATRRVTERGQSTTYLLHQAVSASRRLFQDDAVGRAYLEALALDPDPRTTSSRLPLLDELGQLGPDEEDAPHVGNVLLFVEEADPAPCVVSLGGDVRYIDVYRFVCIYPTETARRLFGSAPTALDLVVWRSVPFPSLTQIRAIEDENERRRALLDLSGRFGYDVAWDPDAAPDAAFFPIDPLGNLSLTPDPQPEIPVDPDVREGGVLVIRDVQLARTSTVSFTRRAVFSAEDPSVWAPDGFEVKVAGPSGSRKVWIHLVLESPATKDQAAVHENTVIVGVRDL